MPFSLVSTVLLFAVTLVKCIDSTLDLSNPELQGHQNSPSTLNNNQARDDSIVKTILNHRNARIPQQFNSQNSKPFRESDEPTPFRLHDNSRPPHYSQHYSQNVLLSSSNNGNAESLHTTFGQSDGKYPRLVDQTIQSPSLFSENHSRDRKSDDSHALPFQNYVPRWSINSVPLNEFNLIQHPNSKLDRAGCFVYENPRLEGSVWDSVNQAYHRTTAVIRLNNDRNGLLFERRLTDFIYSIVKQIEISIKVMQIPELPVHFYKTPLSDFQKSLSNDELYNHRSIKAYRSFAYDPHAFSFKNEKKADQLFNSAFLGSDLAILSSEILKLPNISDQNQLGKQISFRLASLVLLRRFTHIFWNSLDTNQRRRDIEDFCTFHSTLKTDLEILGRKLESGKRLQTFLESIEDPNDYFVRSIRRVNGKFNIMHSIWKMLVGRSLSVSNQADNSISSARETTEIPEIHLNSFISNVNERVTENQQSDNQSLDYLVSNSSALNQDSTVFNQEAFVPYKSNTLDNPTTILHHSSQIAKSESFYEKALTLLNIQRKSPSEESYYLYRNAVTQIKSAIESNLIKAQSIPSITAESRARFRLTINPEIVECLTIQELSTYLNLFNARVLKMRDLMDLNIPKAIDLIKKLILGDDLFQFSTSILEMDWANQSIIFDAAGKYLAHLTNNALSDRLFWIGIAKSENRLIEWNRFEAAQQEWTTVEAELEAGRKLVNIYKNVKNNGELHRIFKSLELKMMSLQRLRDDHIAMTSR